MKPLLVASPAIFCLRALHLAGSQQVPAGLVGVDPTPAGRRDGPTNHRPLSSSLL